MNQLVINIIGGLIVAGIASWLNFGGTTKVVVHGTPVRKTGKWIILISVVMIIGGLAWAGSVETNKSFDWSEPATIYGLTITVYGLIFLIIGKIVAWFQRP